MLGRCLDSIRESSPHLTIETIVVDSGSYDGTVTMVRERYPWVVLLPQPENVGFPRGNNIGFARANGRYLLALNPDTQLIGDALSKMLAYLEENPTVGLVGPLLRFPDGSIQHSRRRFPNFLTGVFESTWLHAPGKVLDDYYMRDVPADRVQDVDWVEGAALMVRREVLDKVGGMDEDYFMYSEEMDWCRRIKDAGWRVVYLPTAEVVHHQGKSSEQVVTQKHIMFQRAKLRYFRKHHGVVQSFSIRCVLLANYGWQIVIEGAKALLGSKRTMRLERMRTYWKVLRSGLKPAGF